MLDLGFGQQDKLLSNCNCSLDFEFDQHDKELGSYKHSQAWFLFLVRYKLELRNKCKHRLLDLEFDQEDN